MGWCEPFLQFQQALLVLFRPAQWLFCCTKRRKADIEWRVNDTARLPELFDGFCKDEQDVRLKTVELTPTTMHFECVVLTDAGFCDVMKILVKKDDGKVEGHSVSTALCPRTCPGACCCSVLCCWFPFEDWGKNLDNLVRFEKYCQAHGVDLENRHISEYGHVSFTIIVDKKKVPLRELSENEKWRLP